MQNLRHLNALGVVKTAVRSTNIARHVRPVMHGADAEEIDNLAGTSFNGYDGRV